MTKLEKQIYDTFRKSESLHDACIKIASLIEQKPDCYEKEFVEWRDNHSDIIVFRIKIPGSLYKYKFWGEVAEYTLDELYTYWQTNIKDKP